MRKEIICLIVWFLLFGYTFFMLIFNWQVGVLGLLIMILIWFIGDEIESLKHA